MKKITSTDNTDFGTFEQLEKNRQGKIIWKKIVIRKKIANKLITFADGSKYEGEWKDNQPNGQGKLTLADGGKYAGKWKDDQPHGQGKLTRPDGSKLIGQWKDGKQHGLFIFSDGNGSQITSEFKDGVKHGKETIKKDGAVTETIYKDGKERTMIMTINGKKTIEGYYKDGVLQLNFTEEGPNRDTYQKMKKKDDDASN